jgi:hypothetical protein
MASDKPETDNFLAQLDARIAALQALRESYLRVLALGALGQPGEDTATSGALAISSLSVLGGPVELPTGAFLGKSIPAAVKLFLQAARRKQSVKDISTALREGGIESTSANFETTVTSALHRLKANGEVLRFKDGWALAEFYPEGLRSRIEKSAAKRGTAKRKRAPRAKVKMLPTAEQDSLKAVS